MKKVKSRMKLAAVVVASVMTMHVGGAVFANQLLGTTSSPFVTITQMFMSTSMSSMLQQHKEAYLAAVGEAANYVQMDGKVEAVSPLLQEVMRTEKMLLEQAFGPKNPIVLTDVQYAQLVVFRVETELKKSL